MAPASARQRRTAGAVTLQGLAFLLASAGVALAVCGALGADPTAPAPASHPVILEVQP